MTNNLPGPSPSPDAGPYWDAAAAERLEVQQCGECGSYRFPPSHLCRDCGSDNMSWVSVSGKGSIYSFSIVHRAPTPAFREHVPYVVALIDLKEGPRMMANIIGDGCLDCAIAERVEVCFEDRGEGAKIPQFRLVGSGGGKLGDVAQ